MMDGQGLAGDGVGEFLERLLAVVLRVEAHLVLAHLVLVVVLRLPVIHQDVVHGEEGHVVALAEIGVDVEPHERHHLSGAERADQLHVRAQHRERVVEVGQRRRRRWRQSGDRRRRSNRQCDETGATQSDCHLQGLATGNAHSTPTMICLESAG